MLQPVWIVGFTGHRPGKSPGRSPQELAACEESLKSTLELLQDKAESAGGRVDLFVSLAAGSDLLVASVAESLGMVIHVILPMPEDEFANDFAGDSESWNLARRFIEKAKDPNERGTFRVVTGDTQRPQCYHETNIQMIQSSDVLIAVWNNLPAEGLGGTEEVIAQAERHHLPIIKINPAEEAKQFLPSELNEWPKQDEVLHELHHVLETDEKSKEQVSTAKELFGTLDQFATSSGKKFRGRLLAAMLLHFIAALLAATNASFTPVIHHSKESHGEAKNDPPKATKSANEKEKHNGKVAKKRLIDQVPWVLTAIEFALVLLATIIMLWLSFNHLHEQWRKSRFAAELIRGITASSSFLDPLNPLILRHAPEWRRFAVSVALMACHTSDQSTPDTLEHRKNIYLKSRVEDQCDRYFSKQHSRAEVWSRPLKLLGLFSGLTAWVFILAALIAKLTADKWVEGTYLGAAIASWFPIVLPLAAGAAISLIVATDNARRSERYRIMAERLEHSKRTLPGLQTETVVAKYVGRNEEILLDELVEWYSAAKNTGH